MIKKKIVILLLMPALAIALVMIFFLCLIDVIFSSEPRRAWNALISTDRALNAVSGDDEIQTISQRAELAKQEGKRWGCVLCRFLDIFEKDHCRKSIE